METALFYLFACLTLLFGLLVVANPFSRNPVTSAMFLVLTIISMAGLFVLLQAFFLAAVQILVYAGAVMVLFLFVIMLLDLEEEEGRHLKRVASALGLLVVAALGVLLLKPLLSSGIGAGLKPEVQGTTEALGWPLFTRYLLPFEIVSLILLVAMIGVILLTRRDPK